MAMYKLSSSAEAMEWGLKENFKNALRKRYEEASKTVIDEAVEEGMKTFEATLRSFRSMEHMNEVVEVILTDRRSK